MKIDFALAGAAPSRHPVVRYAVSSEVDPLEAVMLCRPTHLAPVPCCSATRESLAEGFILSRERAETQHDDLCAALERRGVLCNFLPADPEHPDMCFTRDALLISPWGMIKLRPSAEHRRAEADRAFDFARSLGAPPAAYIREGRIEGGDIAIVRPGLIIIGWSGERTDEAGAEALATIFRAQGWEALLYPFDPYYLHLDTQFCMVADNLALACTDVLDDAFLAALELRGIGIIPVDCGEARRLGCNILSLGRGSVITSAGNDGVNQALLERGFDVEAIEIDQFTRCGGGIHCLTMPLARRAARH